MIVFVTNILLLLLFIALRRYLSKDDRVKKAAKKELERTNNLLKNSKYKVGDRVLLFIPAIMHKTENGRIRDLTVENDEVFYIVDIYFSTSGLSPINYWIPINESCIKLDRKTRIKNLIIYDNNQRLYSSYECWLSSRSK